MTQNIVSFHYTLTSPEGKVLDSSSGRDPLSYLEGAKQIIPGLEKEIQSLNVSDKKKVTIPSAEAYGPYQDQLVLEVPKENLPKDQEIVVGMQFQAGGELSGRPPRCQSPTQEIAHGHSHGESGQDH